MLRLLVADKNVNACKQIASILIEAGYDVMVTPEEFQGLSATSNTIRILKESFI